MLTAGLIRYFFYSLEHGQYSLERGQTSSRRLLISRCGHTGSAECITPKSPSAKSPSLLTKQTYLILELINVWTRCYSLVMVAVQVFVLGSGRQGRGYVSCRS